MTKLFFALALVSLLVCAASAQTAMAVMGYQSFACRSSAVTNSIAGMDGVSANGTTSSYNSAYNITVNPEGTSNVAAAASAQFLYNVVWGPPSYYEANTAAGISQNPATSGAANSIDLAFLTTAPPSGNSVLWHASIANMAANGYPFGCCGGVGPAQVHVLELGCVNCLGAGAGTALPVINSATATNNLVPNGASVGAFVPGSLATWSSTANIANFAASNPGVAVLQFPPQTATLGAGVYSFQLWAQSLCGVSKSNPVSIAARCPPSPTVLAVLRSTDQNGAPVSQNGAGAYTLTSGTPAYLDASCSFAYQYNKPWFGTTQESLPVGTNVATTFNPNRNLYAIQAIYFTPLTPTMTTVGSTRVVATGATSATSSSAAAVDSWGTTVNFNVQGTHQILVTVTDGCSASQATITVIAGCSCPPTARIVAIPTIWSNNPGTPSTTNVTMSSGGNAVDFTPTTIQIPFVATLAMPIPYPGVTTQDSVPNSLIGYTLTGSATDYENIGGNNLSYDYNFFSWIPNYAGTGMSVTNFLPGSTSPPTGSPAGLVGYNFPPSMAAQCTPPGGAAPAACTGTGGCCFSTADIVNDVATVVRPVAATPATFVYRILQVNNFATTTPPTSLFTSGAGATWSNILPTASPMNARVKVYNFMRIGSGCAATVNTVGAWQILGSSVSNSTANTMYYALPLYLQSTGTPAVSVADFNGFPAVNSGGAAPTDFHPTTECGAWIRAINVTQTTTYMQYKVNSTSVCNGVADLVLCRVTISQLDATSANIAGAFPPLTQSYANNVAQLTVSSYGACKGQWVFSLAVDDSCNVATDYVTVNVGCNRAPVVSAGCTNSQTWIAFATGAGFDQISLDGRASFDPDNFYDAFDGTYNNAGTFPGCGGAGQPVCINGGLGTYGLTYAWALASYTPPAGSITSAYPNATNPSYCPLPNQGVRAQCAQTYCSGAYFYPTIDLYTSRYVIPGAAATALSASPQGTTTLGAAWQWGLYGVNSVPYVAPGTVAAVNTSNTMPVFTLEGAGSLTQQQIFPAFNPNCAPTVFPIYFAPTTGASGYFGSGTGDYLYAQQIQHAGNSAYLIGLTNPGTYVARLYAFDGCSVGSADVTFVLECPALTIQSAAPAPISNLSVATTYISGTTLNAFVLPSFSVIYGGSQDVAITPTITIQPVTSSTSAVPVGAPIPTSCVFTSGAITSAPGSRSFDTSNAGATGCTIFNNLAPGSYVVIITASDGCARTPSPYTSAIITINCPNTFTVSSPTTTGTPLVYPGFTSNAVASGVFPDYNFNFNISSSSSLTNFDYMTTVYWKPTANPTTATAGLSFSSFFTAAVNTQNLATVPAATLQSSMQTGVYAVTSVSDAGGSPATNNALTAGVVKGGSRVIQFPTTGPVTLAARTNTDTATGFTYNTAANWGQSMFFDAARSSTSIYWAGDYYVHVTGSVSGAGSCGVAVSGSADQMFSVTCAAIGDPFASVATPNQWPAAATPATYYLPGTSTLYFGTSPYTSSTTSGTYCSGSNPYCPAGSPATGNGGFTVITMNGASVTGTSPYTTNAGASTLSFRIGYKSPAAVTPIGSVGTSVGTVGAVSWGMVYQNPLLLSPFSYISSAVNASRPWYGNANGQLVAFGIPGTWTLDAFNTNGCQNVSSANQAQIAAVCYDYQMPEANIVANIQLRPFSTCAAASAYVTDANNAITQATGNPVPQCNVNQPWYVSCGAGTATNGFYAVRGALLRPGGDIASGSPAYVRRRIVPEEAAAAAASSSSSSSATGRKLLQVGASPCSMNTQTNQASTYSNGIVGPATAVNSAGATPAASYTIPQPGPNGATTFTGPAAVTTPVFSANFAGQVRVFFNSFDLPNIAVGTLRNFYGMGDLFGTLPTAPVISFAGNQVFQGAFDSLTLSVDPRSSPFRNGSGIDPLTVGSNSVVNWMRLPAANMFATAPTGVCSWQAAAANLGNTWETATLTGCSAISATSAWLTPVATINAAGVQPSAPAMNSVPSGLTAAGSYFLVSQRGTGYASGATSDLLSTPNAQYGNGRASSRAGDYDFMALAWNGMAWRSCYDYRSVRVTAICNRLLPWDATTPNSPVPSRDAMEGPMISFSGSTGTNPASYTPSGTAPASIPSGGIALNWLGNKFDMITLSAGFKYYQCGLAPFNGNGNDACGQQPGSADGEGNYYSLNYQWAVIGAPANSIFAVGSSASLPSAPVFGPVMVGTPYNTTINGQIQTTTNYTQNYTQTNQLVTRSVELLNHGYKYPMTTFRPDVASTTPYLIQLTISDGCSQWMSPPISITATCPAVGQLSLSLSNNGTQITTGTSPSIPVGTPVPVASASWPAIVSLPMIGGASAGTVTVANYDGSQYSRISMAVTSAPTANQYWTYKWSVSYQNGAAWTPITGLTNAQGSIASFVPTEITTPATSYLFQVQLLTTNLCADSANGTTTLTYFYIQVNCQVPGVTTSNFIFGVPVVSTWASNPQLFWGLGNPTVAPNPPTSNFANIVAPTGANQAYYRPTALAATTTAIGNVPACLTTGPYCGPDPSQAAAAAGGTGATATLATMPTILFAGSVYQGDGSLGNLDNELNYYNNVFSNGGSVTGAAWQQLYFSIPATLTSVCKIKSTYWVLSNYQNALPFVPMYVPTTAPVVLTCTPTQEWSWTVTSTPCTTCTTAGTAYQSDSCDFDVYDTYRYNTGTYGTGIVSGVGTPQQSPTTQTGAYTGYMPPTFNYIQGTGASAVSGMTLGQNLNAYCVYDTNNRLDSIAGYVNLRANCRMSGRGLTVDINNGNIPAGGGTFAATNTCPGVTTATTKIPAPPGNTSGAGTNSLACPMANIAFVPNFPGPYVLTLNVFDNCGPPVMTNVPITASCRTKPQVTITSQAINSYYYCGDNAGSNNWGSASGTSSAGKFSPISISDLVVATAGVYVNNQLGNVTGTTAKPSLCTVAAPTTTMTCSDVRSLVNNQPALLVDTNATNGNKFQACCTCLYGTQTINVFGSGTTPSHQSPSPPTTPGGSSTPFGPTTQGNNLALSDEDYNRNNIILIALVTPMAVLLVGSLAGNVLMVLKMRQGASSGGGFNVRAGDVELSTSPRSRVDV